MSADDSPELPRPGLFHLPYAFLRAWHGWTRAARIAVAGGAVLTIGLVVAAVNSTSAGPSESYTWGQGQASTAATLVNNTGMHPDRACNSAITAGAVWADDPILNPDPPPKNFNRSEAKQGCLDILRKR